MKSKHMAGTFTKKKKCKKKVPSFTKQFTLFPSPMSSESSHVVHAGIISGVYSDIPAWKGREREESTKKRAYFGIETGDRIIEFECRNKSDKQMWIEGIQYMMNGEAYLS